MQARGRRFDPVQLHHPPLPIGRGRRVVRIKELRTIDAFSGWLRISDIVKRECALAVAKAAGRGAFGKHKAVTAKVVAAGLYRDRGWL